MLLILIVTPEMENYNFDTEVQCKPRKFHFGVEAIVLIPLQWYNPKTHS